MGIEYIELEERLTQKIYNQQMHSKCTIHQGRDLTLIQCPDSYELYHTPKLASLDNTLTNYGDMRRIEGVRNSYESGKSDRLTFV